MTAPERRWWEIRPAPEQVGPARRLNPNAESISVSPFPPESSPPLAAALQLQSRHYHRVCPHAVSWRGAFYPFQQDGIDTLLARDALLLADDMGLGKTVQTVAAFRILFRQRRVERALVVAPVSLLAQWRKAAMEWAPELRTSTIEGNDRARAWRAQAHIFLVSYDTLRSDFTVNAASPPRRHVWDVVVLDEAQRIKNPESEISQICKRLPRKRAWALTGTPLENRIEDLASVCEFVTPWQEPEKPLRLMADVALLQRHANVQLRRKKALIGDQLPPKTIIDVPIDLAPEQRRSYELAEREGRIRLREMGKEVQVHDVLVLIVRLKQICNVCPHSSQSAKLDDAVDRLEAIVGEGNKALVFSQFTDEVHGVGAIARRIRHLRPLAYTGDMDILARGQVIQAFERRMDGAVMVLSLRAGGLGLNLQSASYVLHFDRWWNPAVENQAEDRAHRLGQRLPVTVYRYICNDTIEERIHDILTAKRRLFEHIVDDVSLDLGAVLSRDELMGVVGVSMA